MKSLTKSLLMSAILVAGAALVFAGCGDGGEPSPGQEGSGTAPSMQEPPEKQKTDQQNKTKEQEEEKKGETEKSDQEDAGSDAGNDGQKTDAGEQKQQEKMVKLEPELPQPMFAGTPSDLDTPILEPNPEKSRESIQVPEGATENLAAGKPVTTKGTPIMGELSMLTDGDKSGRSGTVLTLPPGKQWVQIDLKQKHKIYGLLVWHYHSKARVYHDIIAQVANNKDFVTDVTTLFNNDQDNSTGLGVGEDYEYIEDNEGKWIPADGVEGRFVRLYSNGSTANELNHYVEVEVYGIPAE